MGVWQARAQDGDVEAMFSLGMTYELGLHGTLEDDGEAYAWYTLAAAAGHKDALHRQGMLAALMNPLDLARALARTQELHGEVLAWQGVR